MRLEFFLFILLPSCFDWFRSISWLDSQIDILFASHTFPNLSWRLVFVVDDVDEILLSYGSLRQFLLELFKFLLILLFVLIDLLVVMMRFFLKFLGVPVLYLLYEVLLSLLLLLFYLLVFLFKLFDSLYKSWLLLFEFFSPLKLAL